MSSPQSSGYNPMRHMAQTASYDPMAGARPKGKSRGKTSNQKENNSAFAEKTPYYQPSAEDYSQYLVNNTVANVISDREKGLYPYAPYPNGKGASNLDLIWEPVPTQRKRQWYWRLVPLLQYTFAPLKRSWQGVKRALNKGLSALWR